MSLEIYKASVAQLYASLGDIAANVAYIQDKLPDCNPPDIERSRINQTCRDFDGAIYDVRKEIRNLEDKLGMRIGQPPFDPDIMNPDPRVTMGFISRWLWTEITAMHQTVLRLQEASKIAHGDGGAYPYGDGGAYLLVAESALNILHDYKKVKEALDAIETQLEQTKPHASPDKPVASVADDGRVMVLDSGFAASRNCAGKWAPGIEFTADDLKDEFTPATDACASVLANEARTVLSSLVDAAKPQGSRNRRSAYGIFPLVDVADDGRALVILENGWAASRDSAGKWSRGNKYSADDLIESFLIAPDAAALIKDAQTALMADGPSEFPEGAGFGGDSV